MIWRFIHIKACTVLHFFLLPNNPLYKLCVSCSVVSLCNPTNCSPPGRSVFGILQASVPEWVAIPFSRGSSQPRDWTQVSCIAGRFFTVWANREAPSMNMPDFIYPCSSWWTLSCLHFFAIMNNIAADLHVQVFVWTCFYFSWVYILRGRIAGSCENSNLLRKCRTVSIAPFYSPIYTIRPYLTCNKNCGFSASSPMFVATCVSECSDFSGCDVID